MIDTKRNNKKEKALNCISLISSGMMPSPTYESKSFNHFNGYPLQFLFCRSTFWFPLFICLPINLNMKCFHFSSSPIPFLRKSETIQSRPSNSTIAFLLFLIIFTFLALSRSNSFHSLDIVNSSFCKQMCVRS